MSSHVKVNFSVGGADLGELNPRRNASSQVEEENVVRISSGEIYNVGQLE